MLKHDELTNRRIEMLFSLKSINCNSTIRIQGDPVMFEYPQDLTNETWLGIGHRLRLQRIEALWWSWNMLSENPSEFPRARALCAAKLLEYGAIP